MAHLNKSLKPINYSNTSFRHFFLVLFFVLVFALSIALLVLFPYSGKRHEIYKDISLEDVINVPEQIIHDQAPSANPRNPKCSHWDCFNVYRCGNKGHNQISIYIYPIKKYLDADDIPATGIMSKEFYFILKTIKDSKYYTSNPDEACIFVPSIDTLNQNRFRPKITSQALNSLSHWNDGENHLIFNMVPGSSPEYNTVLDLPIGKALVAGAGFDTWAYRSGFDISLPVYSILAAEYIDNYDKNIERKHLLISSQLHLGSSLMLDLGTIASEHNDFLLLQPCNNHHNHTVRCDLQRINMLDYPKVLQSGVFCLVHRAARLAQQVLLEAMAAGCIPVVVADGLIMPFQQVIDWKRAAIFIQEENILSVIEVLKAISDEAIIEKRDQVLWLYKKYFSSIEAMTNTVLDIINDRVFPQFAKNYRQWNLPPNPKAAYTPLFLPITAPKSQGFTAVVLTYDRIESLFALLERLVLTPSLQKVLVIWNNQKKSPPPLSAWPKINKPFKVIQTKANKLSNRFYPYNEIETEAILTIDDDIIMLTADELEFGFEVWREFPDRIVGYPSRMHVWDNVTNHWKYESEWTNEVSMVLTGAAFHHKYWSYMYTTAMPGNIKEWVDDHMNCEDIAMNFLVANITNKAPIKVAPRKKFKCPECTNTEMLSADLNHMIERSNCIHRFSELYGTMPLKAVEFRADPVLYKDPFPEKLKRFNQIGSL
ncbi:exostosin-2-like [Ctenocephalides felis]|uniref:exostosin-2-like n=1 Tax=Ctenocephalides felis TaxID=7515 RepID=UPI000E6E3AED|nr:exostosin-2-like [Ctenocephalides felis]